MQCKQPQPVADTSVSTNKSPNIPNTQKITIDSTKYPVPNQLLLKEQKYPLRDRYKIETGNIPVNLIHILGLHQGCQTIYDHEVQKTNTTNASSIDIEFEENLPHQEGIISEIYQRPDKSYFQEPKDLENLVDTSKIVQKLLPKQCNIDKILNIIQ